MAVLHRRGPRRRSSGRRSLGLRVLVVLALLSAVAGAAPTAWAAGGGTPAAGPGPQGVVATTAPVVNDVVRRTTSGAVVRANAGSVLQVGAQFYWYGMEYDGTITDHLFTGTMRLNVYRSVDLSRWTFVRSLLTYDRTTTTDDPPAVWLGRPDVTWSGATGDYVLTLDRNVGFRNDVAFYTSRSPTGPFTRRADKELVLVDGVHTMGNKGEFQDTDGTAYLLFVADVSTFNSHTGVARLTPEHLGVDRVLSSCGGRHREALTVVRDRGSYYLMASETRGWLPSPTWYKRAPSMGAFRCSGGDDGFGWTRVRTEPSSADSFGTQHGAVVPVRGTLGTAFVEIGDRWSQFDPRVGGVGDTAWFPLSFDAAGTPVLHGRSRWWLDVTTGRWH